VALILIFGVFGVDSPEAMNRRRQRGKGRER
jgi:hypothetical protein